MLGRQGPEDIIINKMRPLVQMISQVADYISQSPELEPFAKAFMQLMLSGKPRGSRGGQRQAMPQAPTGLASPASLASGPGATLPGMPRPPVM